MVAALVAAVGAAGFVIGFARRGTLANLAAGRLSMTQRPFDVDEVSLSTARLDTLAAKRIIVPDTGI